MNTNLSTDVLKSLAVERLITERIKMMLEIDVFHPYAIKLLGEYKHPNVDLSVVFRHVMMAEELLAIWYPEQSFDMEKIFIVNPVDGYDDCVIIYYRDLSDVIMHSYVSKEVAMLYRERLKIKEMVLADFYDLVCDIE
jgi:hypothetical protein